MDSSRHLPETHATPPSGSIARYQEHNRGMKRKRDGQVGRNKNDDDNDNEDNNNNNARQLGGLTGSANRLEGRGQQETPTKSKGWCERQEGTYTCTQYNVVANHGKETALHRSHA